MTAIEKHSFSIKQYYGICFIVAITFLRLWMQMHLNYVVVFASIDDNVAILQAEALLKGQWLGPYNMMTLAKGYTYPLFLCLCHILHLPYSLGLGLLIVFSSLMMMRTASQINTNQCFLVLVYLIFLFLPIGHNDINQLYFYRNALAPWLVLLIISSSVHLFITHSTSRFPYIVDGIVLSISLTAFVYLREDYQYIFIYLFMLLGLGLLWKQIKVKQVLLSTLIVLLVLGGTHYTFSKLNEHYYHISLVNDRINGPFAKMMTLFYQMKDDQTNEHIWISKDTLDECIKVSPCLASLSECITHSYANWARAYFSDTGIIEGDFMQWVMRNALYEAGFYQNNAKETQAVIKQINQELTTAFQKGKLKVNHRLYLSSQIRRIDLTDMSHALLYSLKMSLRSLMYPQCISYYPLAPIANEDWVKRCEALTLMTLDQQALNDQKMAFVAKMTDFITLIYRLAFIIIILVKMIDVLLHGFSRAHTKVTFILSFSLLCGAFAHAFSVSLFVTFLLDIHFYKYTSSLILFAYTAFCLNSSVHIY